MAHMYQDNQLFGDRQEWIQDFIQLFWCLGLNGVRGSVASAQATLSHVEEDGTRFHSPTRDKSRIGRRKRRKWERKSNTQVARGGKRAG